ncbi:ABC transporter substrate-binding protein [Schaalia sp. 19OD2882]|uniref:ABC transporter substrate-binding protein n=1 Tax=Schaalia sp. 19OD2882 TaxID=2794089 RepID=UPI001C1EBDFD|nr:ABC transporter substrate-binding protein [Schaalia sp. 19OD2882]QWW19624.1 ABC transporter substrate-binding protein [Schaalia sp. 19OD2882]
MSTPTNLRRHILDAPPVGPSHHTDTTRKRRRSGFALAARALAASLLLASCGTAATLEGDAESSDPGALGSSGVAQSGQTGPLVVGSQDYYSNEIIAEVYAQALQAAGHEVRKDLRIGQREVYMPELAAGRIDVLPEYSGNLLQYVNPGATARTSQDVHAALVAAVPQGLRVLDQAAASDQDTYVVTTSFANEHGLRTIADLAKVDAVVLGGNSELETRPYGPKGLRQTYGVNVSFTPIEDSGGALTVKALRDGQVQLVDIYSADPVLSSPDLVALEDPQGLLLASHVVPVVSQRVGPEAAAVINRVSAALDPQDLRAMNRRSVDEGAPASQIAKDWLASEGLG